MKNCVRISPAVALAVAALAMPSRASASGPYFLSGMCSPSGLVCTTARFWLAGSNLMFDVFNGASLNAAAVDDSRLSGFAVFGMPTGVTGTFTSATFFDYNGSSQSSTDISSGWTTGVLPPLQNLADDDAAWMTVAASAGVGTCNATAAGPLWDTCQGGNVFSTSSDYVEFTFALSGGTISDAQLALLGYAWKAQSVAPNGEPTGVGVECSTSSADARKGLFCNGTTDDGGTVDVTVTPEPATMALLATGLVALGVSGRRRRKTS